MGCQIQSTLTLKSLQSVGVVAALMESIQLSGADNVNGKDLGIRWSFHKAKSFWLELPNLILGSA
jgi:hypothetical protein